MGLFDGIVGSVLGGIADIWSTNEANSAQADMQRQAYEYQKESMQNRHQWEVEDLRKAGLNPILSATNSAGGVISVGAGQAHKADIGKTISSMMNAITNSAVGRNEIEISKKDAESRRIAADADKLRAETEKDKAPSAIALNEATANKFIAEMDLASTRKELETLLTEAKVDEITQRLMIAHAEAAARIESMLKTAEAAQTSAAAALMHGEAALSNADVQKELARIAEENGVSLRDLNRSLAGKNRKEFEEISERIEYLKDKRNVYEYEHPRGTGHEIDEFGQVVYQFGDYASAIVPLRFNFGD